MLTPQGFVILVILLVIIYSPIVQLCVLVTASMKHTCYIELENQPWYSSITSLYILYNYVAHKITIWYAESLYLSVGTSLFYQQHLKLLWCVFYRQRNMYMWGHLLTITRNRSRIKLTPQTTPERLYTWVFHFRSQVDNSFSIT